MSYKDCITATLKHRLTLARIAQRRLGRWLRGKHDFKIHSRFQLWRSTVLPVLTYGIFATGIHPQGIMRLQREMYKMLRQVVCDHASRTGQTNYLALTLHSIATPLQQLRAAAEQLLQSITQRLTRLQADDITLQLPWDHLNHLVTTLANTQELSSRSVEPSSLCVDPSSPDLFQCTRCDFVATNVATFRRHCTMVHGLPVFRSHFALASQFTNTGLPECKHCGQTFTTWRRFQIHIERGCQVLYSGPCATETHTALGVQLYQSSTEMAAGELAVRGSTMIPEDELDNLRQPRLACHCVSSLKSVTGKSWQLCLMHASTLQRGAFCVAFTITGFKNLMPIIEPCMDNIGMEFHNRLCTCPIHGPQIGLVSTAAPCSNHTFARCGFR